MSADARLGGLPPAGDVPPAVVPVPPVGTQALARLDLVHGQERLRLAGVLDAMLDAVALVEPTADGDFRFAYVNRAAHDAGQRAGAIVHRTVREVFDPDTGEIVLALCRQAHRTGEPAIADPFPIAGSVAGAPLGGAVTLQAMRVDAGVVLTWRDVTGREQAAEALRRSRAELAHAQRVARLGSWTFDPVDEVLACSDEMSRLLGRPPGSGPWRWEALRATVEVDGEPATLGAGLLVELAGDGGTAVIEHTVRTIDDEALQVISYATVDSATEDRARGPTLVRGTTQDLTELRSTQTALRATRRQLVHEQAAVDALQRATLPAELPCLDDVALDACYLPAMQGDRVGGDWYDVLVLDEGLALVVGDVVGHGLASATLMAELRNAVRAYLMEHRDPGRAMARANEFVHALRGFATCACVIVDRATGVMRGVSAGHPPPLVGRPGEPFPWYLPAGSMLGATPTSRYDVAEAVLPLGGRVVLYTDGVVERRGEAIDVGIQRLAGAVAAAPSGDLDCGRVVGAVAGRPRIDDACMLVATRRGVLSGAPGAAPRA